MGSVARDYDQVFLGKLFDGIAGLIFGEDEIVGYYSKSNEQVYLKEPVSTRAPPEVWLKGVEVSMKRTLYVHLHKAIKELLAWRADTKAPPAALCAWIETWPGQLIMLAAEVLLTESMERAFRAADPVEALAALKADIER